MELGANDHTESRASAFLCPKLSWQLDHPARWLEIK